MTRTAARTAVLLCFLFAAASATAQNHRPPTVDDVIDMVQVSDAQISPNGKRVLFTRSEIKEWKANKRVSSIWVAGVDGGEPYQFLGSDKDRSPRWSPDGNWVALLSTRDQKEGSGDSGAEIWLIRADGGEATRLTSHDGAIRAFEWSADSSRIFFTATIPQSEKEKAAEKSGEDAIFVDEGPNGQSRGHYAELWTIPLDSRKETRITKEPLLLGDFAPSPDGRRVAYTWRPDATRNGQYKSEIAVVDVATSERQELTHNQAPESNLMWSPDGQSIVFEAPDQTRWELAEGKLWIVPASGGTAKIISGRYSGAIGRAVWSRDGQRIVFGGTKNGRAGIYELNVASGDVRAITPAGDRMVGLDSVTPDLTIAAGITSSPTAPPDVSITTLSSGDVTTLTKVNPSVGSLQLATFRVMTWTSRDGTKIEGLLWLPADYKPGTKLPLLLSVHGGPAGVWTPSFRGINHVYAGLGWAVLEPNVRGSSSYGDTLLRGNMKDIGGGDYQDLMTGVDKLIADGIVDPQQLAIRGWSYGGILGGWTITQTPRFKAASLGAMVTDWSSEYAMGFNHDVRLWYIGGTPWDNAEAYRRQSSYTHIASVTTPTILFHGEEDTTDTIGQSMMFYQGLKDRAIATRLIRFPREPHGFREPHHQRIRDIEEIAWLMKYARGIDWKAPARPDEAKKTTE